MKKLTLFLLLIIFMLLLAGSLLIYGWTRDISSEAVETALFSATMEDEGGVDPASAFQLRFAGPISSAAVNKALSVSPEIDFGVHQGSSKQEVLITPALPLEQDTVYTFTLSAEESSYSWAVQTKAQMSVKEVRPADKQTRVSEDASIELVLSSALCVDPQVLAEHIQISPEVAGSFVQKGRVLRFVPEGRLQPGTVYTVSLSPGLPFEHSDLLLEEGYTWSFETKLPEEGWSIKGASSFTPMEVPSFSLKGLPLPEGQAKTSVLVSLYDLGDAEAYAEILKELAERHPAWSASFSYYGKTAVDQSQRLFSKSFSLEAAANGKDLLLQLDQALPVGCYMLRVMQGAVSRDCFFMVSPLQVYVLTDSDQALLWCFDAGSGQALAATVADLWGGDGNIADKNGLAQLTIGEKALFSVSAGEQQLLLPLWQNVKEQKYPNAWRYLYSDKSVYANGDTINYYGLLATRDGSKLDYDRVSVYIVPSGAGLDEAVYRGYADLNGGVFSGALALPQLLPGEYSLEIWQSGLLYIQRSFQVNNDAAYVLPASGLSSENTPVLLEPGQEYVVPGQKADTARLYVQASGGIHSAEAGLSGDYKLHFDPENLLDSYILALDYGEGGFALAEYTQLSRSADKQRLLLTAEAVPVLECGKENEVRISVSGPEGEAMPNMPLSVQILSSALRPEVDTLQAIYQDYQGSGLSLDKPAAAMRTYGAARTLAYAMVQTDENGVASLRFSMPAQCQEKCYLVAQAITCGSGGVYAGSLLQQVEVEASKPEAPEESIPKENAYSYTIESLRPGLRLDADSRLLICGARERMELLDMLLEPAFYYGDSASVELLFSRSCAQRLLVDYGGDNMSVLFAEPFLTVSVYQKADGGLGEKGGGSELELSAKLAAMTLSGVSYPALREYFENVLEQGPSRSEQAIALAGLASCGVPCIREIKALLRSDELDDHSYCWLLWALLRNGDRATATQLYAAHDFGKTERGELLSWRAVLAAALGEGEEALSLLEQAGGEKYSWAAERVLVARSLLTRCLQQTRYFSYEAGADRYAASVSGISDYFLAPLAFNGTVHFNEVDEGLSYCNIVWSEPDEENKLEDQGGTR